MSTSKSNSQENLDHKIRVTLPKKWEVAWLCDKMALSRGEREERQRMLTNQATNFGPLVREVEQRLHQMLHLPDSWAVVSVCNATIGLQILVNYWRIAKSSSPTQISRPPVLRWAVQSMTFPATLQCIGCHDQGSDDDLDKKNPTIRLVDVDPETGILSTRQMEENGWWDQVDGLIVTNILGNRGPLTQLEQECQARGKILLLDNAATPCGMVDGKPVCCFGQGSVISLHHTKPLGFGEAGAVIVPRGEMEADLRALSNFGYHRERWDYKFHLLGTNAKLSDISAAGLLAWWDSVSWETHLEHHQSLLSVTRQWLQTHPHWQLFPTHSAGDAKEFPSCLVLLAPRTVTLSQVELLALEIKVEFRKYYLPLQSDRQNVSALSAWSLFDRIICVPCHLDMTSSFLLETLNHLDQKLGTEHT